MKTKEKLDQLVNNRNISVVIALVLIIGVIIGLYSVNYLLAKNNPGGNDFLVHYIGARSLIFDDLSPYSDEVAIRIQTIAYGHPAQGIEHELRVAYPLYSVFLFAPFSVIGNYAMARAVWMTVLEVALIMMVFLALDLVKWKPSIIVQASILLFSMLWYHAIRSVINGNAVILVTLLLMAVLSFIKSKQDQLAGILLAITTIKPHLVVLIIPFIMFWAIYNRRWRLIGWFIGSLGLFIGLALVIMPDWIYQNIWEVLKYPAYNPAGTIAAAFSEWYPAYATEFKWAFALVLGILIIIEGWKARNKAFNHFLWTAFLILTAGQWIGIQTDPGNFILLFPVLILIISVLNKRWEAQGQVISFSILGGLFLIPWVLFILTIQRSYQPVQSPIMFIPLPLFGLLGLYWIRWWVVGPKQTSWIEDL